MRLIKKMSFYPLFDDIARHRLLIPLCDRICTDMHYSKVIDPYSYLVIKSVDPLCMIPCALLAAFSLRYAELAQLNLDKLTEKTTFTILQDKTGVVKTVHNYHFSEYFQKFNLDYETPLCVITYNALRVSIKKACLLHQITLRDTALCATHFFRHAWASWAFESGVSEEHIKARLGHSSDTALDSYIKSVTSDPITI